MTYDINDLRWHRMRRVSLGVTGVRGAGVLTEMTGWALWVLAHNLAMVAPVAARDAANLELVRDHGGILLAMSRIAPMEEKLSTLHFMASHLLGYAEATTADIRRAIGWARQFEAWAERGGVSEPDDTSDWAVPVRHVPVLLAGCEDAEWALEAEEEP